MKWQSHCHFSFLPPAISTSRNVINDFLALAVTPQNPMLPIRPIQVAGCRPPVDAG
jgi:hypothetical protein